MPTLAQIILGTKYNGDKLISPAEKGESMGSIWTWKSDPTGSKGAKNSYYIMAMSKEEWINCMPKFNFFTFTLNGFQIFNTNIASTFNKQTKIPTHKFNMLSGSKCIYGTCDR